MTTEEVIKMLKARDERKNQALNKEKDLIMDVASPQEEATATLAPNMTE